MDESLPVNHKEFGETYSPTSNPLHKCRKRKPFLNGIKWKSASAILFPMNTKSIPFPSAYLPFPLHPVRNVKLSRHERSFINKWDEPISTTLANLKPLM